MLVKGRGAGGGHEAGWVGRRERRGVREAENIVKHEENDGETPGAEDEYDAGDGVGGVRVGASSCSNESCQYVFFGERRADH